MTSILDLNAQARELLQEGIKEGFISPGDISEISLDFPGGVEANPRGSFPSQVSSGNRRTLSQALGEKEYSFPGTQDVFVPEGQGDWFASRVAEMVDKYPNRTEKEIKEYVLQELAARELMMEKTPSEALDVSGVLKSLYKTFIGNVDMYGQPIKKKQEPAVLPAPATVAQSAAPALVPTKPRIAGPVTPAPPKAEEPVITPPVVPQAPFQTRPEIAYPPMPKVEFPEEIDVKQEIQKIIGGLPRTAEELVGKERPKTVEEPWYVKMLRGAAYGATGRNVQEEFDKVQKRLDEKFSQDLEVAKSRLNVKTQAEFKQLEITLNRQDQKFEGMRKLWASLGEANPDRFLNDPEYWAMGAKANFMPEEALRKWVQAHYNPQTGKYEGIYIPKFVREWESKKFIANELPKVLPGYPPETYMHAAFFNKWPDMLETARDRNMNIYLNSADPKIKSNAMKALSDIEKLKKMNLGLSDPDMYKLNDLLKRGVIDKNTYDDLIKSKMAAFYLDGEQIKLFTELQKQRAVVAAKEVTSPTEGMIKFSIGTGALSTPTGRTLLEMDPSFRNMGFDKDVTSKFSTEYQRYDSLIESIRTWKDAGGKGTPWTKKEDETDARKYFVYQKKVLRNIGYSKVIKLLESIPATDAILLSQEAIKYGLHGVNEDALLEQFKDIVKPTGKQVK